MNQIIRRAYDKRLAAGHNFLVFFGAVTVSFAKISGLENELSTATISEGGVNDAMVVLPEPRKKLGRAVYEHGVGMLNPLNMQFEAANNLGAIFTFPTTVLIFDNGRTLKRAVGYNGGVPVKWSVSELNAQSGSIVLDRLEVVYQGIFNVPV